MSCFLSAQPQLKESCKETYHSHVRAFSASQDAARSMFVEPSHDNAYNAMRASTRASLASAIAMTRASALAAEASATAGDYAQKYVPMMPVEMFSHFARSASNTFKAVADMAEKRMAPNDKNGSDDDLAIVEGELVEETSKK